MELKIFKEYEEYLNLCRIKIRYSKQSIPLPLYFIEWACGRINN
jgi:hypothetical protein